MAQFKRLRSLGLMALTLATFPSAQAFALDNHLVAAEKMYVSETLMLAQAQPLRGLPQSPTAHIPSARQQLYQQRTNQRNRLNNRALLDQMERQQNMQRRTYPSCASATTAPCQPVR